MDNNSLVASIVASVSWPVAMLLGILLVRRPMKELFALVRKVRYGDLEFDFGEQLQKLETEAAQLPATLHEVSDQPQQWAFNEYIARLAAISPPAAVSEAWKHLESALVDAAGTVGVDPRPYRVYDTLRALQKQEIVPQSTVNLLHELRILRNQAAHSGGQRITISQAIEYGRLVERVADTLAAALRRVSAADVPAKVG